MLKLLPSTIVVPITVLISLTWAVAMAKGQDAACFMITSSGKVMDLSNLCGDQPTKATATLAKGVFQAPIKRRHHGIPVINVNFNGTHTFEMLVDTGASNIVLTPQVAAVVGFTPTGTVKASSATERGVEMALGRIASVEVAGAVLKNPEVTVSPALDIGLLGENFFKDYDVTVRENVIEFRTRQ